MHRCIQQTKDGSSTIYVPALDEHYHSIHGAVQESLHVFISAGFAEKKAKEICILEIGLGTGLNALLTAIAAENAKQKTRYTAVEKYPVAPEETACLNYAEHVRFPEAANIFAALHNSSWETETEITPHFSLVKWQADFNKINQYAAFDVIYFDAFAPSAQPDLWTPEMFARMYDALKPSGILVTYCAKGQVKRNMKAAGFSIEALPGPPGKREMTRATKPATP